MLSHRGWASRDDYDRALAQELKLPREKITLVAPPFAHTHEQSTKQGPKIVEFKLVIEDGKACGAIIVDHLSGQELTVRARVLVNATGPWGNTIGRMVGVEYPIRFSREHEAIFHAPTGFRGLPVMSDSATSASLVGGPRMKPRPSSATTM